MAKSKKNWNVLTDEEKRDLNMISKAYFDLFSPLKRKPDKYEFVKWLRNYKKQEK